MNAKENIAHQNLKDAAKAVFRGEFVAVNDCMKLEKKKNKFVKSVASPFILRN